jgi:hypothetical protein
MSYKKKKKRNTKKKGNRHPKQNAKKQWIGFIMLLLMTMSVLVAVLMAMYM